MLDLEQQILDNVTLQYEQKSTDSPCSFKLPTVLCMTLNNVTILLLSFTCRMRGISTNAENMLQDISEVHLIETLRRTFHQCDVLKKLIENAQT